MQIYYIIKWLIDWIIMNQSINQSIIQNNVIHNLSFGLVVFAFGLAFNRAVPAHLPQNGVHVVVRHLSCEKDLFFFAVKRQQVPAKLVQKWDRLWFRTVHCLFVCVQVNQVMIFRIGNSVWNFFNEPVYHFMWDCSLEKFGGFRMRIKRIGTSTGVGWWCGHDWCKQKHAPPPWMQMQMQNVCT